MEERVKQGVCARERESASERVHPADVIAGEAALGTCQAAVRGASERCVAGAHAEGRAGNLCVMLCGCVGLGMSGWVGVGEGEEQRVLRRRSLVQNTVSRGRSKCWMCACARALKKPHYSHFRWDFGHCTL